MVMKPTGESELVETEWNTVTDTCLNDRDSLTPACGTNPYPIAALLAPHLMNECFLDPTDGYDGHTDWVVTFPMKKHGINAKSTDVVASFETVSLTVKRVRRTGRLALPIRVIAASASRHRLVWAMWIPAIPAC